MCIRDRSKPLFLIFISSVLYFIKKINRENRVNAAVIINNGYNIETWIDDSDKILIEAGWCNVFHQSTEYFIIGTLIIPATVIIDVILNALSLLS